MDGEHDRCISLLARLNNLVVALLIFVGIPVENQDEFTHGLDLFLLEPEGEFGLLIRVNAAYVVDLD